MGIGKGGGSAPPAPAMPQDNTAMMMEQYMTSMNEMFMKQQESMNAMMSNMQTTEAPEVIANDELDWAEKNAELQEKMAADYDTTRAKQVGRSDTVLTSPLLDEEEPTTTTSILGSDNA